MTDQDQYNEQRNAAFDRILTLVQSHIDAIPVGINLISSLSPGDARDAAERDVWSLFRNGIQHLKDGGQKDAPGSFGEAISKASLRSGPMAATLGVKPPQFIENYYDVEFDTGASEAVWRCQRLLEALAADAPKSQQLVRAKLGFTSPLRAADAPDVNDPELKGVFDAAQKSAAGQASEDALIVAIRRQTVLTFNLMSDIYLPLTQKLGNEIADLFAAPKPRPTLKNQSFDL